MKYTRPRYLDSEDISYYFDPEMYSPGKSGEHTGDLEGMWQLNMFGTNRMNGKTSTQVLSSEQMQHIDFPETTMSPGDETSVSSGGSPTLGLDEIQNDASENPENYFAQSSKSNGLVWRNFTGATFEEVDRLSSRPNGHHGMDVMNNHSHGAIASRNQGSHETSRTHSMISVASQSPDPNGMALYNQGNQNRNMWLQPALPVYSGQIGWGAHPHTTGDYFNNTWANLAQSSELPSRQHHTEYSSSLVVNHSGGHSHDQGAFWSGEYQGNPTAVLESTRDYQNEPGRAHHTRSRALQAFTDHSSALDVEVNSGEQDDLRSNIGRNGRLLGQLEVVATQDTRSADSRDGTSSTESENESDDDDDDAEAKLVRNDPRYRYPPGEDGFYHCPFLDEEDCNHAPTKLKCNYDKYIDSHIKPHRCNMPECKDQQFSSTACRLRHEREAHGAHGHGLNPYLCQYEECPRAKQGHGFPRSWNRNDHMRRCHDHQTSPSVESVDSPSERARSGNKTQPSKKHKLLNAKSKQPAKKAKVDDEVDEASKALRRDSEKKLLLQQWKHQYGIVHRQIHDLKSPHDHAAAEKLHKDTGLLAAMSKRLAEFT